MQSITSSGCMATPRSTAETYGVGWKAIRQIVGPRSSRQERSTIEAQSAESDRPPADGLSKMGGFLPHRRRCLTLQWQPKILLMLPRVCREHRTIETLRGWA